MDSHEDIRSKCLGRWMGGKSFTEFTEIEIFMREDTYILRRVNSMSTKILEGPITWDSASEFRSSVPVWTQVGNAQLKGTFRRSAQDLTLDLEFERDGMAGRDATYVVKMSQHENHFKKFRHATTEDPPVLSSTIFSMGNANDLCLTATQLASAVRELLAPNLEHSELRTDGVMLLKDGKIILESYQWGMDAYSVHLVASITKSLVGIMVGIALDQHLISLSDVLSGVFPEMKEKTKWGDDPPITVQHALSMTSGTKFGDIDTQAMLGSSCVEEVILSAPRLQSPGERFRYDNSLPTLLAVFLERKTSMSFESFVEKYLFGPLGITQYHWSPLRQNSVDGKPLVLTSGGLSLTVPDMAKIGQLMLDGGVYNGKRILSHHYVNLSATQHTPQDFYPYGYCWHLNTRLRHFGKWEDAYMALGAGENVICVIPSQRIVFVAACSSWRWQSLTPPILETLSKTVLKELV